MTIVQVACLFWFMINANCYNKQCSYYTIMFQFFLNTQTIFFPIKKEPSDLHLLLRIFFP